MLNTLNNTYPSRFPRYFCTKQPNLETLRKNSTFAEARQAEANFFKTGLWAALEPTLKDRLEVLGSSLSL